MNVILLLILWGVAALVVIGAMLLLWAVNRDRNRDPHGWKTTVDPAQVARYREEQGLTPNALVDDECGTCGGPILRSDPRCTLSRVYEDADGGGGSSATFHVEHCPDTGADHAHGTTTIRVGSAP